VAPAASVASSRVPADLIEIMRFISVFLQPGRVFPAGEIDALGNKSVPP
jgi:hypothetical protein